MYLHAALFHFPCRFGFKIDAPSAGSRRPRCIRVSGHVMSLWCLFCPRGGVPVVGTTEGDHGKISLRVPPLFSPPSVPPCLPLQPRLVPDNSYALHIGLLYHCPTTYRRPSSIPRPIPQPFSLTACLFKVDIFLCIFPLQQ